MKTINETINENCKKNLITGYGKTTYSLGFKEGVEFILPYIEMAQKNFEGQQNLCEKLTTGNLAHSQNTLIGKNRRNSDFFKKLIENL